MKSFTFKANDMSRKEVNILDALRRLLKGEEVYIDGYILVYLEKGDVEVRGEYFEVLHSGIFFIGEKYDPDDRDNVHPALLSFDITLASFIRMCGKL